MKTVRAPARTPWHIVIVAMLLAVIPASFVHSPATPQEKAAASLAQAELASREAALASEPTVTTERSRTELQASFASTGSEPAAPAAPLTGSTWTYTCEDVRFSVAYRADEAVVSVAGRELALARQDSRVDAKFASDAAGLWIQGDLATLELEHERWIGCRGETDVAPGPESERLVTAEDAQNTTG